MPYKKIVFVFVIIGALFITTGCWDAYDVNQKTLVVTVIADKQGDNYAFYIETPNISIGQYQQNGVNGSNEKYITIYANGPTFADARRHLNAEVDNPIFLGTVRALVMTDDLAKYDVQEYMMRMQSNIEYRKALYVVTSRSDPNDILAVNPPNNVSIGESISDTISSLESQGKIVIYTVSDILEFIYSHTCFVVINMDVKDGYFAYNGYSVIHDNKLIDFIPLDESNGLVWILGDNIKRIYSQTTVENCRVTTEVNLKKRTITPYYENGRLTFDINFQLDSNVAYLSKNIKLDDKLQKIIKEELQKQIAGEIADTIERSKKLKCDYLQFRDIFRIKYPNEVKNINWLDTYLNAEFKISVESTLEFGSMMDFAASGD